MSNNTQIIVDESTLSTTNEIRKAITQKHKKVSFTPTPAPFVKQRQGQDYVEIGYMREIADKEYAGWSWEIVKTEKGIWRTGDMVAAHRIQTKRGTGDFVDIGNDIKAANTDCMKKAMNMYLNIADDVYRNQIEDLELSDEMKNEILVIASEISESKMEQIHKLIKDQKLNTSNYNGSLSKLKRERDKLNEKDTSK